jgi:hypothetical protein
MATRPTRQHAAQQAVQPAVRRAAGPHCGRLDESLEGDQLQRSTQPAGQQTANHDVCDDAGVVSHGCCCRR